MKSSHAARKESKRMGRKADDQGQLTPIEEISMR